LLPSLGIRKAHLACKTVKLQQYLAVSLGE